VGADLGLSYFVNAQLLVSALYSEPSYDHVAVQTSEMFRSKEIGVTDNHHSSIFQVQHDRERPEVETIHRYGEVVSYVGIAHRM